jgi:hypothetical protein
VPSTGDGDRSASAWLCRSQAGELCCNTRCHLGNLRLSATSAGLPMARKLHRRHLTADTRRNGKRASLRGTASEPSHLIAHGEGD